MATYLIEVIKQGAQGVAGATGADGLGVPAGGATGYVLRKVSGTDNDTVWADQAVMPDGEVLWDDYIAQFSSAPKGNPAPTLENIGNGHQLNRFDVGDNVYVEYHVLHDYKRGAPAFFHIHFVIQNPMVAGETIGWQIDYIVAKSHHQGESLTAPRSTIQGYYVADGTEVAGEHLLLEDTTGIDLKEPDTQLLVQITRIAGTYTGKVWGIQGDLHYQIDRLGTPQKVPDFYTP